MQEVTYRDKEGELQKAQEYFAGETNGEVWDKMRARLAGLEQEAEVLKVERRKIGRNDPCPCGSGKKFKKCCISAVK